MQEFKEKWATANKRVWKTIPRRLPLVALIVTNSGHKDAPYGTPVLGSMAESGITRLTTDGESFFVDFVDQTVAVGNEQGRDRRVLDPLTEEQKAYFGVDFGGQYSS